MQDQIDVEKEQEREALRKKFELKRAALQARQVAYAEVFEIDKPGHVLVLKDLARFCRAHSSTFHLDARAHALQEGRREVWLRIMEHLNLDDKTLWKLYNNGG